MVDKKNINADIPPNLKPFTAWPPPNYVMDELVYPRWSFHLLGHYDSMKPGQTDVSNARVRMWNKANQKALANVKVINKHHLFQNMPTIVWTTGLKANDNPQGENIQSYIITIDQITVQKQARTYTYTVHILDADQYKTPPPAQ